MDGVVLVVLVLVLVFFVWVVVPVTGPAVTVEEVVGWLYTGGEGTEEVVFFEVVVVG